MNGNFTLAPVHLANGTVSADAASAFPSVPHTLGLTPVQLGYIFLALFGSIPLMVVITTITVMKCYTLRKLQQCESHLVERQRRKLRTTTEPLTSSTNLACHAISANGSTSIKASRSNPNVYFQQKQTIPLNPVGVTACGSPAASDDFWQPAGGSTSTELGSEEARALASFDGIYDGIDINSDNSHVSSAGNHGNSDSSFTDPLSHVGNYGNSDSSFIGHVSCTCNHGNSDSSFTGHLSCISNYGDSESVTLPSYVYTPEVPSNHYYSSIEA